MGNWLGLWLGLWLGRWLRGLWKEGLLVTAGLAGLAGLPGREEEGLVGLGTAGKG